MESHMLKHPITFDDILAAEKTIRPAILKTAFEFSRSCSEYIGSSVFLKYENLQKTGSFKIRGAYNKLSQLTLEELKRGVSACSAGNHAQGVAHSASLLGAPAYIVMPEVAPVTKVVATQGYGAQVILHGSVFDEAEERCRQLTQEKSLTLIHPYEDPHVVAGQGTIALEIYKEDSGIDTFIIPIGGGGLIAGMATAIKHFNPQAQIIGAVAQQANAMKLLYNSQGRDKGPWEYKGTIADGIAVKKASLTMYEHYISKYVDDIIEVTESEIAESMVFLLERSKTVVEGASGVGLAAAKKIQSRLRGRKTCLLLCGGNVDLNLIASVIEKGLEATGRLSRVSLLVEDIPGVLNKITQEIAIQGANILEVTHKRLGLGINIRQTQIDILMGTKSQDHIDKIKEKLKKFHLKPLL